mgnify:CR=1 FL=1
MKKHLYSKKCVYITKDPDKSPAIPISKGKRVGVVGYVSMVRGRVAPPDECRMFGYIPSIRSATGIYRWIEDNGYRVSEELDLNPPPPPPKMPKPKARAKKK